MYRKINLPSERFWFTNLGYRKKNAHLHIN